MCGIAGIISPDPSLITESALLKMASSLAHRGPDGQATWTSDDGVAGFSHRRLCVIDISDNAAQPMHYRDRYTIVYNGEIYNYKEIREELISKGHRFITMSDTEVILAAFSEYGEACTEKFDGMFSFAIWDAYTKQLFCARDRFGEKPFYYFFNEQRRQFIFGSEMKAIHAYGIPHERNNTILLRFIANGEMGNPDDPSETYDSRIKKLPQSCSLVYSINTNRVIVKRYWTLSTQTVEINPERAYERFMELLTGSVNRRLRSDVSVGATLSGGLDSSSIAVLMKGIIHSGFPTITAVFPGFERDEAAKAEKVADKLKLKNVSIAPTANGLAEDFEKLLRHQEQPFSSASVYAQYKLFELAAGEQITVLLDGQGADETIAGYDHFRNWKLRSYFPELTSNFLKHRAEKALSPGSNIHDSFLKEYSAAAIISKPVVRQLNDLLYYHLFHNGLEELLRYADRNSMAHGREVRLPFLNHDLVSFVFSLPPTLKIGDGYTKLVLRKVMSNRLPGNIVWEKKKTGFEPPQKKWMQHAAMQERMAEARKMLVSEGVLDKKVLKLQLRYHDSYEKNAAEWRWLVAGSLMIINKKGV